MQVYLSLESDVGSPLSWCGNCSLYRMRMLRKTLSCIPPVRTADNVDAEKPHMMHTETNRHPGLSTSCSEPVAYVLNHSLSVSGASRHDQAPLSSLSDNIATDTSAVDRHRFSFHLVPPDVGLVSALSPVVRLPAPAYRNPHVSLQMNAIAARYPWLRRIDERDLISTQQFKNNLVQFKGSDALT